MKYVRVILAVQDEDVPKLQDYLSCFIETEVVPLELDTSNGEDNENPIQGAYTSDMYETREEAIHGKWSQCR
jgi:hypothetical protein